MNSHVERMVDSTKCTGCTACVHVCPKNCIEMRANDEGFLFPHVCEENCIDCGLCAIRCPALKRNEFPEPAEAIAAVWADQKRKKSASGGIAAMIAEEVVVNRKGHVYGCVFDANMTARHICISNAEDLPLLQGSKYVQSDPGHSFFQIKEDLEQGIFAAWIGMPCQIAGLRAYLGREYENLICIDLICHGVPSPELFAAYIEDLQKRVGSISSYHFRNKDRYSREGFKARYQTTQKKAYRVDAHDDPYYSAFAKCETFRLSCYQCPYASVRRTGDISIGDSSSVVKDAPDFYPNEAVSAVLLNTEKGRLFWNACRKVCAETELNLQNEKQKNHQLHKPSHLNAQRRTQIYEELKTDPDKLFSQTLKPRHRLRFRMRMMLENMIPYAVRRRLRVWQ